MTTQILQLLNPARCSSCKCVLSPRMYIYIRSASTAGLLERIVTGNTTVWYGTPRSIACCWQQIDTKSALASPVQMKSTCSRVHIISDQAAQWHPAKKYFICAFRACTDQILQIADPKPCHEDAIHALLVQQLWLDAWHSSHSSCFIAIF